MSGERRRVPRVLRRPPQGWSSLLLMIGMLLLLGRSIADARPLPLAGSSETGSLMTVILAAGLIGFLLARSGLGVVRAHIIGAVAAAFVLLMVAGAALIDASSPMPESWAALSERISAVWLRLDEDVTAYLLDETDTPTIATFLVLGAICWTTAQFSAFGIFRYDRGGPAVIAIGAVLFLNVGLGSLDPGAEPLPTLGVLTAFSAMALLLLMRLQLTQQRQQWARRHIADTGEVSRLFLRSGVLFVVLAVVSASSLTAWARIDAPEVEFGDLQQPLEDIGEELSRVLRIFGVPPALETATTIDGQWTVEEIWDRPNGVAFRATVDGLLRDNYWWGWAHDHFDGQTWDRDLIDHRDVDADEPLPIDGRKSAGGDLRTVATIAIESTGYVQGMAFRPAEADVIDRDVRAWKVDDGDGIGDITYAEALDVGDEVTIEAWVRDYSTDNTTLTANELRRAHEDYPPWVRERYLQGADVETIGQRALDLAEKIGTGDDPYDRALELQKTLRGADYAYTPDMQDVCEDGEPIPECVLRAKRGFCQHYATTMAMVLRAMDVPSRVVTGYLPGELEDGAWVVEQAAFHNWVEVYFPGKGWVRFDPTPRNEFGLTPTDLPRGAPYTPGPDRSAPPTIPPPTGGPVEPSPTPGVVAPDPGPESPDDPASALLVGGGIALAMTLVVMGLLFVRLRRLSEADGGVAYRGIVSLATRLGYGPHPSQTEYEYAGTLSETLPSVRNDLYLVADAHVETAYGQRQIGPERRSGLRRAYARIRTALLRFSLRLRR